MRKIVSFLLRVVLFFTWNVAYAAEIDLTTMTTEELKDLRKAIDDEITRNHSTTYSIESNILGVTEKYVENYLKEQGASSISWPWFDYTYTREWNFFTIKTTVSYKTENKRTEANIY